MTEEGFTAEELVQACNRILVFAGLVARVANVEEVRVVCSSTGLFVAVLEAFLQRRLGDVLRTPSTPAERAYNIDQVVDVLSLILSCDLSHISGARIVQGSIEDISNLLELFATLCQDKPLLDPPTEERDTHPSASVHVEPPISQEHSSSSRASQSDDGSASGDDQYEVNPDEDADSGDSPADGATSESGSGDASADDADTDVEPSEYSFRQPARRADDGPRRIQLPGPSGHGVGADLQVQQPAGRGLRQLSSGPQAGLSPIPERNGLPPDEGMAPGAAGSSGRAAGFTAAGGGRDGGAPQQGDTGRGEAWPDDGAHRSWHSGGSTTTLLERALSQADATLHELGQEYEDLYYEDYEDHERGSSGRGLRRDDGSVTTAAATSEDAGGSGNARSSGPAALRPARRNLRMAAWPDGQHGSSKQQRDFLRRAQRALRGEDGEGGSGRSSVASSTGRGGPAGPRTRRKAAGAEGMLGGTAGTHGTKRREGGDLLRLLSTGAAVDRKQGRKLMQRTAAAYSASVPAPLPASSRDGRAWAHGMGTASTKQGMHLSADLEGKLRYVYGLATEDPRLEAARRAVQQRALQHEQLRHVRRRELVERLGEARARREAALRLTSSKLREQSEEHERRVEQLKLQRLAAEWTSRQRSAQMQRALQAELTLREAFMEVLAGEKEVLLAARRDAKAAAEFPQYQRALRKAEQQYTEIFNTLEAYLASERQQRVRAHQEALQAQRHGNKLAATVVHDRMQEVLGRIAQHEEALLHRHSVTTQPQSKEALVAQIRRLLSLE